MDFNESDEEIKNVLNLLIQLLKGVRNTGQAPQAPAPRSPQRSQRNNDSSTLQMILKLLQSLFQRPGQSGEQQSNSSVESDETGNARRIGEYGYYKNRSTQGKLADVRDLGIKQNRVSREATANAGNNPSKTGYRYRMGEGGSMQKVYSNPIMNEMSPEKRKIYDRT